MNVSIPNTISMKKFLFILFVLSIITINAQTLELASPESAGMSSKRLERLTDRFKQYIHEGALPGTVTLIARKGKIVYLEALGESDLEAHKKMKEDAIFRIASQTKAIISVGIMMLQEEGKLLIHDPVSNYIPEFKNSTVAVPNDSKEGYEIVAANREITIRDLLSHTAGISYGGGAASQLWKEAEIQGWYFAHRDEPIVETIKRLAILPQEEHPGKRFVYGYNTDILGAVIEIASGMPLDQFVQQKILDPLEMNDTHFYLPKSKQKRLATVYNQRNGVLVRAPKSGGMEGQGLYVDGPRKSFSGGAGLLSTANDYAKFLQMMLNNGVYNNHRLLSRKSVELMTSNHLDSVEFPWTGGTGFGLGFSIVTDLGKFAKPSSIGEYGWGGAYHSSYWVNPKEELIVVYFTQVIPISDVQDHDTLRALVYQSIID